MLPPLLDYSFGLDFDEKSHIKQINLADYVLTTKIAHSHYDTINVKKALSNKQIIFEDIECVLYKRKSIVEDY